MSNFREHLADQAERKIYTAIGKEKETASSMSIGVPVSLTTNHQPGIEVDSPSIPAIDHVGQEADPAKKPMLTASQFGSSHEPEQGAQQVDWRLSGLDKSIESSRDWDWSEEEGDQAFDHGCEEWRRKSLAALEGRETHGWSDATPSFSGAADLCWQHEETMLQQASELDQSDPSGSQSPSKHPSAVHQQDRFDESNPSENGASDVFVPKPEWVESYKERRSTTPKTPQQSNFDQVYEAYSPEKLKSPPKMRFAHERDLLDLPDLHHARVEEADDPIGSINRSVINRALQSPERLLFFLDDNDTGRTQDVNSADSFVSTSGTSLVTDAPTALEHTPADRDHEQAPSDDNDDVSHFGTLENMLFVSILRAIFAAEGGLAALPEVLLFDDDDVDEDDEDEISELELNDCDCGSLRDTLE